ncbi:hypothetical protein ACIRLA_22330 [Streptomyces sp. NPDC102364]|uniref:hypothetical protein n=1 Tax=Streptomyces sp. NPDC102364 TaxID=3366161 RepID=UPI00380F2DD8
MSDRLSPQRETEIRERAKSRADALTAWLNKFSPLVEGQREVEDAETVLSEDVPALLAELSSLRTVIRGATDQIAEQDDEIGALTAERAALKQRLHDAAMTRTWRNEDGKKFVFVEDIAPALLGTKSGTEATS